MYSDLFQLKGKTALVTGAGSGLGQAISCGFSDAGARIAAVDTRAVDGGFLSA